MKNQYKEDIQQELAGTILEALKGMWELQVKNYDIEVNYPELQQTLDLAGNNLDEVRQFFGSNSVKYRQILEEQTPARDPEVPDMFAGDLCPVPNNPAVKALIKAVFFGGKDTQNLEKGWRFPGGRPVFECEEPSGGSVKITLKNAAGENNPGNQAELVESFSLFTADLLMGVLGQICHNFCENRTVAPQQQRTIITASRLLRYKNIQTRGQAGWQIKENIHNELEKLAALHISMENQQNPRNKSQKLENITCKVFDIRVVQRRYNIRTCTYTPTAWEVTPGKWLIPWMSTGTVQFIGKLHRALYQLDHREQRGSDVMAKKIGYTFLTVPGGTYYLKNGFDKSVSQYLNAIGANIKTDSRSKNTVNKKLAVFNNALEKLAGLNLCECADKQCVERRERGRSSITKVMSRKIKITPGEVLKID